MMIIGPILILIGIVSFQSSFSNARLNLIKEYDTSVEKWNSGIGKSGAFEKLSIEAKFSTGTGSTTVLLGALAPEPLGDVSQSDAEIFTTVDKPYYYTTKKDDKTINEVYPAFSSTKKISLTFQGEGVASSPDPPTTFNPMVDQDTAYSWYCSGSSSSSSSRRRRRRSSSRSSSNSDDECTNTCNNPSSLANKRAGADNCDDWCRKQGGTWTDNGNCYDSKSATATKTGCCTTYYGSRKACFKATLNSAGKAEIKAGPCASGDSTKTTLTTMNGGVLYGSMESMAGWGEGMEVSVRHEQDPYIKASELTNGCSSSTDMGYPSYKEGFSDTASTTNRCFGMTAGEIRQEAINLMLIGALLSIFPCSVIYCLMKKSNNNNNGRGTQSNRYRANNNANSNFVQGPTIIGQQKQFQPQQPMQQFGQQQPVQAQFVQQPVQAQYAPQPVQAQYAPQPVQAQYAPQPVYTPQPVQPVQPVQQQYAAQPVGVVQTNNVQFVSK